jgi:hypothetical protein
MKEWLLVLKAADAATRWHVHQGRKGPAEERLAAARQPGPASAFEPIRRQGPRLRRGLMRTLDPEHT